MLQILQGDVRELLPTLPSDSVQCIVTSPPYWGLRDYGVEGQIGLEPDYRDYIATLVTVFRELRRILKPVGTCWMNLGDSYSSGGRGSYDTDAKLPARSHHTRPEPHGLKPKDLVGIPWRVALALQDDGWYLRQDIIWHKPNPMPESVTDRCTKAHEYLFLLTKSERYFYNAEAIKEPVSGTANARRSMKTPDGWDTSKGGGGHGSFHKNGREKGQKPSWNGSQFHTGKPGTAQSIGRSSPKRAPGVTPKAETATEGVKNNASFAAAVVDLVDERNKRSVWTVPTAPFAEAHFATYPPALITPCILAGSRPGDTVMDPFGGSGTTAQVALELGRHALILELNPDYLPMIQSRTQTTPGLALS